MGFWSALGSGLADYSKARLHNSKIGRLYGTTHPQQDGALGQLDRQVAVGDPNAALSTAVSPTSAAPTASMDDSGNYDNVGDDSLAGGKVVTTPTRAIIGEHGPEAVVPLTTQPGQKISAGMLGGMMPRTRYQRVTGPNAARGMSPIKNDLPLKLNPPLR